VNRYGGLLSAFCFYCSFYFHFLLDQKVKQKIKSHRSRSGKIFSWTSCGKYGRIAIHPSLKCEKQNENEYSKTSSPQLLIPSSLHPFIPSSLHLLIPSSPHLLISSSPHLLIPFMRIIYRLSILEGLMRFVGWKKELFGNQKNRRFSLSED
jgi:hypothetical protein